jgi:hypothetical protein
VPFWFWLKFCLWLPFALFPTITVFLECNFVLLRWFSWFCKFLLKCIPLSCRALSDWPLETELIVFRYTKPKICLFPNTYDKYD